MQPPSLHTFRISPSPRPMVRLETSHTLLSIRWRPSRLCLSNIVSEISVCCANCTRGSAFVLPSRMRRRSSRLSPPPGESAKTIACGLDTPPRPGRFAAVKDTDFPLLLARLSSTASPPAGVLGVHAWIDFPRDWDRDCGSGARIVVPHRSLLTSAVPVRAGCHPCKVPRG
jgi:hypothetical protein